MAQIPVSGQPVQLPGDVVTGADIKNAAGVDLDRQLLMVRPEGVRLVLNEERIQVQPDDRFEDVPDWRFG